jgi:hypothetical protein
MQTQVKEQNNLLSQPLKNMREKSKMRKLLFALLFVVLSLAFPAICPAPDDDWFDTLMGRGDCDQTAPLDDQQPIWDDTAQVWVADYVDIEDVEGADDRYVLNIGEADDVTGTFNLETTGTLEAGQATITKMNLGGGLTEFILNGVSLDAIVGATSQIATELQYVALQHSNVALAGSRFMLSRSRGTLANPLILAENDAIAAFDAAAYDGTDYVLAGQIDFEVDGEPGGNDMPGRIMFKTTADGGILPATKWTIKSTGDLLSGTDGTGAYNILTAGTLGAGDTTLSGDLAVNGGNITSSVDLTIQPDIPAPAGGGVGADGNSITLRASDAIIESGSPFEYFDGGAIIITSGDGDCEGTAASDGAGGAITITVGDASSNVDGVVGGDITLTAGAAGTAGSARKGGDINLTGGAGAGGGEQGDLIVTTQNVTTTTTGMTLEGDLAANNGTFSSNVDITIPNNNNTRIMNLAQNDTTNAVEGIRLTQASAENALVIDANADCGNSTSTGGAILLDNTGNIGAGFIGYTNADDSVDGRLMNLRVDNVLFDQAALHIDYDGSANVFEIVNNSTDSSSQALSITGNNPNDTTFGISGVETGKGTLKVVHTGTGTDANAAGISIDLQGTGTAAQGYFMDATGGGTTGNLAQWKNNGDAKFVVDSNGNLTVAGTFTVTGNSILCPGDLTITPTGDDVLLDSGLTVGSTTQAGDNNLRVEGVTGLGGYTPVSNVILGVNADFSITNAWGIDIDYDNTVDGNINGNLYGMGFDLDMTSTAAKNNATTSGLYMTLSDDSTNPCSNYSLQGVLCTVDSDHSSVDCVGVFGGATGLGENIGIKSNVINGTTNWAFYTQAGDSRFLTTYYDDGSAVQFRSSDEAEYGQIQMGDTDLTISTGGTNDDDILIQPADAVEIGATSTTLTVETDGDSYWVGSGTGIPYGCVSGTDETVTCTDQNTWYQVTFDTEGDSNLVTPSSTNNDLTITKTGIYFVAPTACLHSAVAHDFELMVKKNNGATDLEPHLYQSTSVAAQVENVSGGCIVSLTANDTVELWVLCSDAAGQDAIFDHVSLSLFMLGG